MSDRLIMIFIVIFGLSSCYNYTAGESNICEVHQIKMKKIVIPVEYGLRAYFSECEAQFPHGNTVENAGCVVRGIKTCLVYRCIECRKEWEKRDCKEHW